MTKAVFLFSAILLLATQILSAQVAISTDGSDPDPSAMLDVISANKGFLPPRMTDEERDAIPNPASGLIIFNTSVLTWQGWNSVSWINFDGSSCIPAAPGAISGSTVLLPNAAGEVYSISAVPNATSYDWTVPSDAVITAGQGTTSITVTFGIEVGNVSVRSSSGCGNSIYTDLSVSCIPVPPVFLSGNTVVGSYASGEVYSITAVPNASSYEWTVPSDATIVSGQGTASITVDFGCLDDISVRASSACGYSDYTNIDVKVGPDLYDYYEGGIVFYLEPDECHGLVCALNDQGEAEWGCEGSLIAGANGLEIGDGAQNTADIVAGCTTADIAARLCDELTLNGYTDWFLPSLGSLNEIASKRYPINAALIANGGTELEDYYERYWTSTQCDDIWAQHRQIYPYSSQCLSKSAVYYVRAVRAF